MASSPMLRFSPDQSGGSCAAGGRSCELRPRRAAFHASKIDELFALRGHGRWGCANRVIARSCLSANHPIVRHMIDDYFLAMVESRSLNARTA